MECFHLLSSFLSFMAWLTLLIGYLPQSLVFRLPFTDRLSPSSLQFRTSSPTLLQKGLVFPCCVSDSSTCCKHPSLPYRFSQVLSFCVTLLFLISDTLQKNDSQPVTLQVVPIRVVKSLLIQNWHSFEFFLSGMWQFLEKRDKIVQIMWLNY